MQRWLASTYERADDLKRTLAAFDGSSLVRPDGHEHVVATFQKLSKQLTLLQKEESDASAAAMIERHFAVPSAVTGLDDPAVVPHLLSTRLDKEQEDQAARRAALATTGEGSDALLAVHNDTIRAACKHLAASALELDLPGAGSFAQGGGTAASGAPGGSSVAAPAPAPAAAAASQAIAHLLVGALRDGRGLELPPPKPSASVGGAQPGEASKRDGGEHSGEGAQNKRARTT